jgi:hypothetical protein
MPHHQEDLSEVMKAMMDIVSVSTLVAWVLGALPVIATLLTIGWTAIRIYETATVQAWLAKGKGPTGGPLV